MLAAIITLSFLVFVHELGHFLVARWSGVRILCFSLGFGPRLAGWRRGETEYQVSWIPLGGYVKMAGEQRSEQTHRPWEYLSKPVGIRARIVAAGPFMNYVIAAVALWLVFMIGFPGLLPDVGGLVEGMPAQAAGFQIGDRVLAINGERVTTWDEMTELVQNAPAQRLEVRVRRNDTTLTLVVTPKAEGVTDPSGRKKTIGRIGVTPGLFRVGPFEAVWRAFRMMNQLTAQTMLGLWSMLTGKTSLSDSVLGPIGIVHLTSQAARLGVAPLLYLVSLLSLSLAIFNLFPVPVLDGGHLLFLALEKLRGRPVSVLIQEKATRISVALLMLLVVFVCVNDVNRLGWVEKIRDWWRN